MTTEEKARKLTFQLMEEVKGVEAHIAMAALEVVVSSVIFVNAKDGEVSPIANLFAKHIRLLLKKFKNTKILKDNENLQD